MGFVYEQLVEKGRTGHYVLQLSKMFCQLSVEFWEQGGIAFGVSTFPPESHCVVNHRFRMKAVRLYFLGTWLKEAHKILSQMVSNCDIMIVFYSTA